MNEINGFNNQNPINDIETIIDQLNREIPLKEKTDQRTAYIFETVVRELIKIKEFAYDFRDISLNIAISEIGEDKIQDYINKYFVDIDKYFLGFLDIYFHLSKMVSKRFNIIDLGCGHGTQSVFFKDHESYFGVDFFTEFPPLTDIKYYNGSIQDFLSTEFNKLGISEENCFVIMANVPKTESLAKLISDKFIYKFIYYTR